MPKLRKRYPRIKGGRTIALTGHAQSWEIAQRFIRRCARWLARGCICAIIDGHRLYRGCSLQGMT